MDYNTKKGCLWGGKRVTEMLMLTKKKKKKGTFIQQGCIKVIKSDSKGLLRKFLFKKNDVISVPQRILKPIILNVISVPQRILKPIILNCNNILQHYCFYCILGQDSNYFPSSNGKCVIETYMNK